MTSSQIGHGYTVLRAVVDSYRGNLVPVGVAAWDSDKKWYDIRALSSSERVQGVSPPLRQFGKIAIEQLQRWATRHDVPYAAGPLPPWEGSFWSAAAEILTTAIRIDSPRAIDPMADTKAELEALFEAVVQPQQPRAQAVRRVDGAVSNALGAYSGFFENRTEVSAFGGAREEVLRRAAGASGEIIVEAVNLAAVNARKEADALVSRMMRIQAVHKSRPLSIVIGYIASPGGLNGEAHIRDWMRERVTADVFDLTLEKSEFQRKARSSLHEFGLLPQPSFDNLDEV